ncbi:MAG TPA: hypothetical protein VF704_09860 [Allosphingosinicella sp.]|jgi:hypothetical protein
MNRQLVVAAAALVGLAGVAAAQESWPIEGWGPGYGTNMGFGRTEGPVTADIWEIDGGSGIAVTVAGCGGVRDYRSFGTELVGGEGEARAAAAALSRLLAEARRVCGFEERLAMRMPQGLEPAFAAWRREQTEMAAQMNMTDMNMIDMNATECGAVCNAM